MTLMFTVVKQELVPDHPVAGTTEHVIAVRSTSPAFEGEIRVRSNDAGAFVVDADVDVFVPGAVRTAVVTQLRDFVRDLSA